MSRCPDDEIHDHGKGFTFLEVNSACVSCKLISCDFSSDGKLLATGGHDKVAVLWCTDTLKTKATYQGHSLLITDVRFSPCLRFLATSSFDKTVRVWDKDNPGYTHHTFIGHSAPVFSLDFCPSNNNLICSCDSDNEIRYWSIKDGCCTGVIKGGATYLRFQPHLGRYIAAAAGKVVSILDVERQACKHLLKGHTKQIHCVCWDSSGELLASVDEDSVKVWTLASRSEGECIHELSCNDNKFHSCIFHPTHSSVLIIGCYQKMVLWNMTENKTITLSSHHEGLIPSLAASPVSGLVASVSHDKSVKLWKQFFFFFSHQ